MTVLYNASLFVFAGILANFHHNHNESMSDKTMTYKRYMCLLCGFIYDEEKGWPNDGIAPGTRWDDIPPAWQCPECGATKDDFEMIEV